jgi:hypothetical protein
MEPLGIPMIAAYSPQARGRSERVFRTHQDRLVQESTRQGIADLEAANRYLQQRYLPRYNTEFAVPAPKRGGTFVPWNGGEALREILCEQHERTVGADNCVRFETLSLQIPMDRHRCHYVKAPSRPGSAHIATRRAPCRSSTARASWPTTPPQGKEAGVPQGALRAACS